MDVIFLMLCAIINSIIATGVLGCTVKIRIVDPREPVNYDSEKAPSSYKCSTCKKGGVKLWHDYGRSLIGDTLRCVDCAGKEKSVNVQGVRRDGFRPSSRGLSDKIGDLVPAIPDPENDNFWLYRGAPRPALNWWRNLLLR